WVVVERRDSEVPVITITRVADVQVITLGGVHQTKNLRAFSTDGATTRKEDDSIIAQADAVKIRVTVLKLESSWLKEKDLKNMEPVLLGTTVYAQSEKQELADQPIDDEIRDGSDLTKKLGTDTIELDRLYDGLKSGQHLI